jgi:hypothetical protein
LQNNRPISTITGIINADIALEQNGQFLYNDVEVGSLAFALGIYELWNGLKSM